MEILSILGLLIRLERADIGSGSDEDKRKWIPNEEFGFIVKSIFNIIYPRAIHVKLATKIWRSVMLEKVCFFLWLLHFNKALTVDNLQKRCMGLVNTCVMCCHNEGTSSHLFIHCPFARDLWSEIFSRFLLTSVISETIPQLLDAWFHGLKRTLSTRGKVLWSSIPHVICLSIWSK